MAARHCSNTGCGQQTTWHGRLLHKGVFVQDEWYCSVPCLKKAVCLLVRRLLKRPDQPTRLSLRKARIGTILVNKQLITRNQLSNALERQQSRGGRLEECLVQLRYVSPRELTIALSEQLGLPWLEEFKPTVTDTVLGLIPRQLCMALKILAVDYSSQTGSLVVALGGPMDPKFIPMLRKMLGCQIRFFVGEDETISQLIDDYVEPRTEQGGEEILYKEDDPLTIAESITDRIRRLGARRILMDSFKDTLWVRYQSRKKLSDLFITIAPAASWHI